jgi:hypothetical protein
VPQQNSTLRSIVSITFAAVAATVGFFCVLTLLPHETQSRVAKYYLVCLHPGDISATDIYAIEKPDAVQKVGSWIQDHVNSSDTVQKARGLALTFWHDELLSFDNRGHAIRSDFLADGDVISGGDLKRLRQLFEEHGERVQTVPARKPPKRGSRPFEQAKIVLEPGGRWPAGVSD